MQDAFELSIMDTGDRLNAIAMARKGDDLAIERLNCKDLGDLIDFRSHIAEATEGNCRRPTSQQLMEFGTRLFDLVFKDKIKSIHGRLPEDHVRIEIISDHSDFQALPWEYMLHPDDTPGPNSKRTIVRIVPTIGISPPSPIILKEKISILYVYAEPIDQDAVDWLEIKDTLEGEFNARLPGNFEIDIVEGADRNSLFEALEKRSYDFMHFTGHGEIVNGESRLILMDLKTKKSDPISAVELGVLLRDKGLKLVVLSACDTSSGDFTKQFSVMAKTLVKSGVPVVIANQFPVTNGVAATFSETFYNELLRSGDVDLATSKGRVRLYTGISLKGGDANLEYGIPTLYRHIGAANILDI